MADLRSYDRTAAHPGCCGPASGHPAAHAAAAATAGPARRGPAETSMINNSPGELTFPHVRTTRLAKLGRPEYRQWFTGRWTLEIDNEPQSGREVVDRHVPQLGMHPGPLVELDHSDDHYWRWGAVRLGSVLQHC